MRETETCLMEHLAKLDLFYEARDTFHQNNPLGSAMNVMDVSIIAAETALPQGAQYIMALFVHGSSSQL